MPQLVCVSTAQERLRPTLARVVLLACLCAGLSALACGMGVPLEPPAAREWTEHDRARGARQLLEDVRQLQADGRYAAAVRVASRALELTPDDPRILRARAAARDRLDEAGARELARADRARADVLDPPPAPLPLTPLDVDSSGLLLALLEPIADDIPPGATNVLRDRLSLRLPGAALVRGESLDITSVDAARAALVQRAPRAVLSLRIERARCGDTRKDGPYSLVWLRAVSVSAAESADGVARYAEVVRWTRDERRVGPDCEAEAIARALEEVLAGDFLATALAAGGGADRALGREDVRALLPAIEIAVNTEIDTGRRLLAAGQLERAAAHFHRALEIDPGDTGAQTFAQEVDGALVLARGLEAQRPDVALRGGARAVPLALDPAFTSAQQRAIEAQLEAERRRRQSLLAALDVSADRDAAPSPSTIATLRPVRIQDREAVGPRLARLRAGGEVEARVLYAEDGTTLARYYFSHSLELGETEMRTPVLREIDVDADGRPDLWIAYAMSARHEIWEQPRSLDEPNLHFVYAEGGDPLLSLSVDADKNGRAERLFGYADGALVRESRDTTGDGRFDRVEHFDAEGLVTLLEEDLNGDDRVDLRTAFRAGKIVRRDVMNPEAFEEFADSL